MKEYIGTNGKSLIIKQIIEYPIITCDAKKNRFFTCFTKRVPYHIIHHLSKITREKTRISLCNMLSHIIKTYTIFVPQNKKKKDLGISRQMHYFCNELKVNGKYESLTLR